MKKVCFLLNNEFVWDSRVYRSALTLIKAGYDVTLLCCHDRDKQLPIREERDGIHIYRIIPKRFPSYRPFRTLHLQVLAAIIKEHSKFHYIHTHDANMLLLGWALSRFWGAKLIYDSHELWQSLYKYEREKLIANYESPVKPMAPWRFKRQLRWLNQVEKMENWLLPRCDALISVNDSITQILSKRANNRIPKCVTVRNMHTHYPIQDKPYRLFHEHFNLPPETKIVLYQGLIATIRGVKKLVEAIPLLKQDNIAVVLMGPFTDRDLSINLLTQMMNSKELSGKVFYKETVLGNELLDWTSSADLGLAPILNVRESYYLCLPNKLFEYIQAELPCGTSNFPEMQNLVDTHQIGFTFDPENPQEIASCIDAYFADTEQRERYRHNVLKAKEELTWEKEQTRLIDLYETLGQS